METRHDKSPDIAKEFEVIFWLVHQVVQIIPNCLNLCLQFFSCQNIDRSHFIVKKHDEQSKSLYDSVIV